MEPEAPDENDPQWQRAHQTWALVLDVEASELSQEALRELWRVLRVKRMEREAFIARLPGPVRRGARIDLEATHETLARNGIPCRLVRR